MAIITISRGTGSGGKILAECIAGNLGYHLVHPVVLVDAARANSVSYEELKKALDETPGIFNRNSLQAVHYLAYIREAVVKEVKDEQAVYYGLAGQVLLRDAPHVLRIFVIANMEYRIKAAMDRFNCDREKATELIEHADKKRDRWVKHFYNIDRRDPLLYDIVINLDHMSINTACELVCAAASQKEFQPTKESHKRLEDLLLSTKIRSRIAADSSIHDDNVEIEADNGIITLKGTEHSMLDADRIRELVLLIPSVKDIKSEMQVIL